MKELCIYESQQIVSQWTTGIDAVIPQEIEITKQKLIEEANEAITEKDKDNIAGEIGDVLFTALSLANAYGIDANEALHKTFEKNFKRINPEIITALQSEGYEGMDLYLEAKRRQNGV